MSRQDAVIANPWTGDYRIDALIEGPSYRWNFDPSNPSVWGQKTTLSFSFMAEVPRYASTNDGDGFKVFSDIQKTVVRESLREISLLIDIDFAEVPETSDAWGQIRFGNSLQDKEETAGYTYLPNAEAASESSGDVYIALGFDRNYQLGGADRETLLHEIGHALGLKHPGDYDISPSATTETSGNFLGQSEDSSFFTIMSYQAHPQGLSRVNYGLYDLLALRKMYGMRPYHADDDSYLITNQWGFYQSTLVDDAGHDTIDSSALGVAVQINLNPGTFSSVGVAPTGKRAIDNLSIAFGTEIESVVGTNYSDRIQGNGLSNRIEPLSGFDTIDGGLGIDTVVYRSSRDSYQITQRISDTSKRLIEVQATNAPLITPPALKRDELTDIERLQFSDIGLAIDMDFNAGLAVKLLHLVFGDVDFSPAIAGNVLRYTDRFSLNRGEIPSQAIEDLLKLDVFWESNPDRTDSALVGLLLRRIWDQDTSQVAAARWVDDLASLVPAYGGQVGFVQQLASLHEFELQIGIADYVNHGLLWT